MRFRFFLLTFLFVLLYGALGFRLYQLQIQKKQDFVKKVQARNENVAELELRRGQIFFTNRDNKTIPVSLNKDYPVIFAAPKEIKEKNFDSTANALAKILGMEEKSLKEIFTRKSNSRFELLSERPTEEQKKLISEARLKGVYVRNKQYRFYPYNEIAASLLGYFGVNEKNDEPIGLYGLEKFYDKKLAEGDSLNLTIDFNIQKKSEQTLSDLIKNYGAVRGTIMVEEPKSGKILALANAPSFNPNEYGKSPVQNFMNQAVQYFYEPGSVYKPLTMATGIDTRVLTPETSFTDTGSVILNGKKIENWDLKAHGRVTMTNVIEQSINTGAVYAQKLIGNGKFYEYAKKFGFGKKTGIDLPDEIAGDLKNLGRKNARQIDFATASFGQGTGITPIQLISAFSSIANGGFLMRPYLNQDLEPYVLGRTVNEETAKEVTAMMESAVTKAKVAAIPGYRIAGKTGTAQIPNFKVGGYTEEYIHTYVGFAPASDARFVVLIKIDKPNVTLAGMTVVPAFRELAQFILTYYNIPPDKVERQ